MDSVTGTPMNSTENATKDGDGDVDMGGSEMDAGHRRTDHERRADGDASRKGAEPSGPVVGLFKLSTKRKFSLHPALFCSVHC